MMEWKTSSSEETQNAAKEFAEQLCAGDVILLFGEMGAGKTVFTKGLCMALGVEDYVTSPTFTVVNEYEGTTLPVYHFDLYRIEDENELFEIGFEEYLQASGICMIEWPQNAGQCLPTHRYEVEIIKEDGVNDRTIRINKR